MMPRNPLLRFWTAYRWPDHRKRDTLDVICDAVLVLIVAAGIVAYFWPRGAS